MSAHSPDLDVVLRLSDVILSREALEIALGLPPDRFEAARKGSAHYAQFNLPEGTSWEEVTTFANRIGPSVQSLFQQGQIGRASLDVALHLEEGHVSASMRIPHAAAAALGRFGINLDVSAYLTAVD